MLYPGKPKPSNGKHFIGCIAKPQSNKGIMANSVNFRFPGELFAASKNTGVVGQHTKDPG